ncbi:hypothetical protein [Xenorhabdus cabanillasii]|nr:hypothetical protein [Xenorhabdus cabanillasii]
MTFRTEGAAEAISLLRAERPGIPNLFRF